MSKWSRLAVSIFGRDFAGTGGLEDWTRAPNSPTKALKWYRIHGKFSSFAVRITINTLSIRAQLTWRRMSCCDGQWYLLTVDSLRQLNLEHDCDLLTSTFVISF